ncbi:MAG: hypothetical protein AUJ12_02050 [Alphaproteobacteria bacterium CG1_02_46_17]|nr:MAG: hypothetical protein AUJ12_02050 [Alphaproteobacteria bacterium CG1_02_46_17]
MSAITTLSSQPTATPLTQQLRNDTATEFGLKNRDTSKERIAGMQAAGDRVSSANQNATSLTLASNKTENNPTKTSTQRGSLVDLSV